MQDAASPKHAILNRMPTVVISSPALITRESPHGKLNAAYMRALEGAGLSYVVAPPTDDAGAAARLLDAADGLVLSGGVDVDPALYGAAPHPRTSAAYTRRDASELALLAAARERARPTLAICRGAQLLNVACGGTLVQDIEAEQPDALPHNPKGARHERTHDVTVEAGSRLSAALGTSRLRVNSFHHQALLALGEGLRATARAADGLIEGVETPDESWWVLGVQWHPEELVATDAPWERNLFAAFATACALSSRAASALR
jgi:putative glutamine amidotransferase